MALRATCSEIKKRDYIHQFEGGCRASSERAGVDEGRDEEEIPGPEGEESGPGPP